MGCRRKEVKGLDKCNNIYGERGRIIGMCKGAIRRFVANHKETIKSFGLIVPSAHKDNE